MQTLNRQSHFAQAPIDIPRLRSQNLSHGITSYFGPSFVEEKQEAV